MSDAILDPPRAAAKAQADDDSALHLIGRRCLLRPLRPQDAAILGPMHADDRVARYMHDQVFDAEFWCSGEAYAKWRASSWAIMDRGQMIGFASVFPQGGVSRCSAEVSYLVAPSHWGRGIASEALAMTTAWTWLARPGLTRLFATIYLANQASQRVATKCGYVCEALLPKSVIKSGRPDTCTLYGSYRA